MNVQLQVAESVKKFIESRNKDTRARIVKTIDLLRDYGYELKMPHSRMITRGVYELRVLGKENIRLFYSFRKSSAFLFCTMVKKTQKLSKHDLQNIIRKQKEFGLD